MVDIAFPVVSRGRIHRDHAHHLYAALCAQAPMLHDLAWNMHPLALNVDCTPEEGAEVVMRCPLGLAMFMSRLDGCALDLQGAPLGLGSPVIRELSPEPRLRSQIVIYRANSRWKGKTIKNCNGKTGKAFVASLERGLAALGVACQVYVGPRATIRIHHHTQTGHAVELAGLSPEDSLAVQQEGLGGKRKFGCGVFV